MEETNQYKAISLILLVLLALSIYWHYETSEDLQRVCELTGAHDVAVIPPHSSKEELDNICVDHQPG